MTKLSNISIEIDNAIFERLNNVKVIVWEEGVLFKDLDFTKTVTIKRIYNSKTEMRNERKYKGQLYYDLFYSSIIVFENNDGNEIELNISSREVDNVEIYYSDYYKIDYDVMFSRWLTFGQYVLSPAIVLSITSRVNNLPWIYYGYDSSNETRYRALDTRSPARNNYILINDLNVKKFQDQVLAQNADQPRQDRTSVQNLIQNLVDVGFNVGTPFRQGDIVSIPQGLLSAVDLFQTNGIYIYLVMLNDQSLKPFYIQTTSTL
jgi:hypothetical protein